MAQLIFSVSPSMLVSVFKKISFRQVDFHISNVTKRKLTAVVFQNTWKHHHCTLSMFA